ncbi:type II toxin-antitoxin system RelE/ParE family toxin [Microseira sp. BLCC-F43]|uniref:type II toxin-antitoxin system RelE family toxin n=1 Tax=Microseira sp. BLCC-F43 TaxID=3153602 RepID=UPI0035B93452
MKITEEESKVIEMPEFLHVNSLTLPSLPLTEKHNLPSSPAIYFAFGQAGEIIYIGRSKKLADQCADRYWYDEMYDIEYTDEALIDLEYFRKAERRLIVDEIDLQLTYEPTVATNNRKRLRPNQVAEWELRIGRYRVFYDVISEESPEIVRVVKIEVVGFKEHNKLYVRGKEFNL